MIRASNLGKAYRLGELHRGYRTFAEALCSLPRKLIRRGVSAPRQEFWALRDFDLEVEPGEVLGVIGPNGAGKSTLLKLLSRITHPTTGCIEFGGRIASLLEVGTGFHHELTGRENVFLNGAILGMHKPEIKARFDEIVAFSGVERFLDTPLKRYSSGMAVRLAFAVAAHLDAEILLVDEVLAVGDYEFQKRCLGRMGELTASGRTVLFVSHQLSAIRDFTTRCVLLDKGTQVCSGDPGQVISAYLKLNTPETNDPATFETDPGQDPRVVRARVVTSDPSGRHRHGEDLRFEFTLHIPEATANLAFSFQICDDHNQPQTLIWYRHPKLQLNDHLLGHLDAGEFRCRCVIPDFPGCDGDYSIRTGLYCRETRRFTQVLENICQFTVTMPEDIVSTFSWPPGAARFLTPNQWELL